MSHSGPVHSLVTSWGVKTDVHTVESWCRVLCDHEPQWGPLIGWRGIPVG